MAKGKHGFSTSDHPNETRAIKEIVVDLLTKGKQANIKEIQKLRPDLVDFFDRKKLSQGIWRIKTKVTEQLAEQGIHPEENPETRSPPVDSEDEVEEEDNDSDSEEEDEEEDEEVQEVKEPSKSKPKPTKPSKVDQTLEEDELSEHLEAMTFSHSRTPADVTAEYAGELGRINRNPDLHFVILSRDSNIGGPSRYLQVQVNLPAGNNKDIVELEKYYTWTYTDEHHKNGIVIKVPYPRSNFENKLIGTGEDVEAHRAAFRERYHNEEELLSEGKTYEITFGRIVVDHRIEEDVDHDNFPNTWTLTFSILEEQKTVVMTSKKKKQMAAFSSPSQPGRGNNANHFAHGGGTNPQQQQQQQSYFPQWNQQSQYPHQNQFHYPSGNGYSNSQAGGPRYSNSNNSWNSNQASSQSTPQTGNYAYYPSAQAPVPAPAAPVPAPAAPVPAPATATANFFATPPRTHHNQQAPQAFNNQGGAGNTYDPNVAYGMDSSNPPAPDYSSSSSNMMSGMRSGRRNGSSGIRKKESKPSTKFRRSPGDHDVKDARKPAADPFVNPHEVNNDEVGGATSFDESINPYPYSSYFGF